MNTEQWETEGKCSECRRKRHCSKPCKTKQCRARVELFQTADAATNGLIGYMMSQSVMRDLRRANY